MRNKTSPSTPPPVPKQKIAGWLNDVYTGWMDGWIEALKGDIKKNHLFKEHSTNKKYYSNFYWGQAEYPQQHEIGVQCLKNDDCES